MLVAWPAVSDCAPLAWSLIPIFPETPASPVGVRVVLACPHVVGLSAERLARAVHMCVRLARRFRQSLPTWALREIVISQRFCAFHLAGDSASFRSKMPPTLVQLVWTLLLRWAR